MNRQVSWCEIISLAGVVDNTDKHEVDPGGGRSEGEDIAVVTRASKAGSVRQVGGEARFASERKRDHGPRAQSVGDRKREIRRRSGCVTERDG